jgi:hypothetical protein
MLARARRSCRCGVSDASRNGIAAGRTQTETETEQIMKQSFFESLETRTLCSTVPLNVNLVLNGSAEFGEASPTGATVVDVPGWHTAGGYTVVRYGTPGFPDANTPGPDDRGATFFAGGLPNTQGVPPQAHQEFDISALAADIDAGRIVCDYSAWLGGFGSEGDDMYMRIGFYSPTAELDFTGRIGPQASDRQNMTAFALRQVLQDVPVGTRRIEIDLLATKKIGLIADGYADNVSLKLSSKAGNDKGFISGWVFNDANGNGKQNGTDRGLAGVTVFVDKNKNARLDAGELKATTDADGQYLIAGVPKGQAMLRQIVPGTFRSTTAVARTVTVDGGLTTVNQKFGDSQTALIAGNIFSDNNANGKREAGEGGLAGVRVFLDFNNNGELDDFEKSTTTDAVGNYSLVANYGTYQLRSETPAGYQQTAPARGQSILVTLAKGKTSLRNIFGVTRI